MQQKVSTAPNYIKVFIAGYYENTTLIIYFNIIKILYKDKLPELQYSKLITERYDYGTAMVH